MSLVWEHTELNQSETLVALALADHANDHGLCWPSIASLAQKARLERRATQYVLKQLEAKGLIEISRATGRGHTSRYRLHLKGAIDAPLSKQRVQKTAERVQLDVIKGATAIAPESSRTIKESSEDGLQPSGNEEANKQRLRDELLKMRKALAR